MRETGILNREISDIISSQGHMDELIVCDAGFPIPLGVRTIDISLAKDKPTVPELIEELLKHHSVEKVIMANQTKET
ncbi:MAG: D-ribose pyranase, partial [Candidatus Brocadiia bacterium]